MMGREKEGMIEKERPKIGEEIQKKMCMYET
jgi:hypothetical protein